jgi:hypothetical protein
MKRADLFREKCSEEFHEAFEIEGRRNNKKY